MPVTGDFRDPNWEPSEAEEAAVLEDFRRTVLWEQAMAAKGVKVLAQRLSPQQEHDLVEAWWREEGAATYGAEIDR
jgi:sugar phosphate isomerase/epimerase